MTVTVEVYGRPAPQGSKRHVGRGVMVESSKAVKPWREAVKHAVLDAGCRHRRGPVEVHLTFYLPRPRSHYRTGRHAHELRPSAPPWPAVRPDLDKLARATCDALTDAGAVADDACIVGLTATKVWATWRPPGARIQIAPMEEQ